MELPDSVTDIGDSAFENTGLVTADYRGTKKEWSAVKKGLKAISADINCPVIAGDANGDNEVNISDAVLIMQSISNLSEYQISESAKIFADVVDTGDGLTGLDAFAIQMVEAKIITTDDLPITSEELISLTN